MSKALSELLLGFGAYSQLMVIPRSQFAGTADTGGLVTALKDTELNVFDDDYFNDDYWVYITSGAAIGDIRNIADFTSVGGIVAPDIDFHGAPLATSVYQIWKCHVQDIIDALNDALVSLVTRPDPATGRVFKLFRKIVFEDLGHSLLTGNAAAAQADVDVEDGTLFFAGQVVTISDDDGDTEECTISSISSNKLTMTANLDNTYETAKNAEVYANSGHYFNLGSTVGNAKITGVFRKSSATDTRSVLTQYSIVTSSSGERQIYFPTARSVDDVIWAIEAIGALETVAASSPADTVSIDDGKVSLLYAETAFQYYDRMASQVTAGDYRRLRAEAEKHRNKADADFRGLWLPLPTQVIDLTSDSDYD